MRRLFIVRKDLHMSAGKLAAQIGHCAEIYWLHQIENSLSYDENLTGLYWSWRMNFPKDVAEEYIMGEITKTVLQARNLNHLLKAKELAENLGLQEGYDFGFVNDLCKTELSPDEGKDTCTTCFWTRPLPDEMAWEISRKYHLYIDRENEKSIKSHFKDECVQKLEAECEKLREDARRGFLITEEEQKKIHDWQEKHLKEKHPKAVGNPGYFDVSGANWEYRFIPTGLGTVRVVRCSCGEEYDFSDWF